MSIVFDSRNHSYKSIENDNIDWISVTTLISHFKKPFDAKKTAEKVSKNKRSKWFGISPIDIQKIWKAESDRSTTLGTHYHNQREEDICSLSSMEKEGIIIPVFPPEPSTLCGIKKAPLQKLSSGIYPEHMVYLKSVGICGQSDLVEVINGRVNIIDYKSNKEIKKESFINWEGIADMMLEPITSLQDCNFNHYALQLSIYMYIILKHNPKLKPGKIFIHHVLFEIEAEDKFGYPIIKLDENKDPIVKQVIPIEVPYLLDEVLSIMQYVKENKQLIKKK